MPHDSSERATRKSDSNQLNILVRRIQACLIKMWEVDTTCYIFIKKYQLTSSHIEVLSRQMQSKNWVLIYFYFTVRIFWSFTSYGQPYLSWIFKIILLPSCCFLYANVNSSGFRRSLFFCTLSPCLILNVVSRNSQVVVTTITLFQRNMSKYTQLETK